MNSAEALGIQAALRALKEAREGVQDALVRDRLERIAVVLSRVGMNISRRVEFEAGLERMPAEPHAVVVWEAAKIASWEGLVSKFDPGARREEGDEENLAARLQVYLRSKFPDLPSVVVSDARRLPGGRSKHTFVMSVTGAGRLPSEIVLRSDSSRTTVFDSVAREFPLIEAVYKAGNPAPQPLWFESDTSVIGGAFAAFARAPGAPAGNLWGVYENAGDVGPALAVALAKLHRTPVQVAPGGKEGSAQAAVGDLLANYEGRWRAAMPGPSVIIERAFAWLNSKLGDLDGPAVIVHGDAHFSNMLMHEGKLSCLLDWEFWHFGHPAEDLAYCRPYMSREGEWDRFLAAYAEAGGPMITDAALRLFGVWRPLRNAVLAANVAHDFVAKEDLDLETAAIALATYPKMEAQASIALSAVLNS